MADDLGIEGLGCYGGEDYRTPHLDRLAATGLRFTHAYSQPLCTPTRVELMTGKDNHRNWQFFGILPKGEQTFGHMMRSFGYKTCVAGKWQLTSYDPPDFPGAAQRRGTGTHPEDAGFDEYSLFHTGETEDKGSRYANPTYERNGKLFGPVDGAYGEDLSAAFIVDFMKRHRENPMFIYFPMALPHWPMVPAPNSPEWKDPERRLEESTGYFQDMVEYMDTLVGRLVGHLERLGLRDETLVLFYSDNGTDLRITSRFRGERIRGGKAEVTQAGIRVPLIANWPGHLEAGTCNALIDPSDFLPTLAGLAGRKVPEGWLTDGVSFAPRLLGEPAEERESAFFWYDPRPGWDKERFRRHVFALDHHYKLFADGRFYAIDGTGFREEPIGPFAITPEMAEAKGKLRAVIREAMRGPLSPAAKREVDAFGNPVER
jgi:arylsulfatase A-like enzyme